MKPTKRLVTLLLTALLLAMPIQSFAAIQYGFVASDIGTSDIAKARSAIPPGTTFLGVSGNYETSEGYSAVNIFYSYDDGGPSAATINNSLNAQTTNINNSLNATATSINNNVNSQLSAATSSISSAVNTALANKPVGIVNIPKGTTDLLTKYGLSTSIKTDGIYQSTIDGHKYKVMFYELPTNIAQLNLS